MTTDKYKGVVEIDILGAKRGFKFGMACVAMLCKLEGLKLSEVNVKLAENDSGAMCNFYYSAAVQYHRLFKVNGPEPTYEEVANWIDNMSLEQNTEAVKAAFEQYGSPNQEAPKETGQ